MGPGGRMKGKPAYVVLGLVLFLAAPLSAGVLDPLPPPAGVEEARARLRDLRGEAGRVDDWVEEHFGEEFAARHPELAPPEGAGKEPEAERRARDMRVRIALSDLKSRMRKDRRAWLERELTALLSEEIEEDLPVRLGTYDADRGEYPLLLGFGWPTPLLVRLRVPAREKEEFEGRFPSGLHSSFRINEKGEVFLRSLDWDRVNGEVRLFLASPEPRLLWQKSHDSWVTSVSFRRDGAQVLSAGADGMIGLWDAPTGNPVWRRTDSEMALSIAFGPDGTTFATGAADSGIRVRDAETGDLIWQEAASGMVFAVAYSADGRHVISGDDGGSLQVRNARTGREILRADLGSSVRSIDVSPGGKTVLVGTEGKTLVLWEIVTGRQIWRRELPWPVYAVAAGEELVAAGGEGTRLLVLRASDGIEVWNRMLDGEIRTLRFDGAGRILGAGGAGYSARVFLAASGEPVWSASVDSPVRSLDFGPGGLKLAVGAADFGVRLFEVEEGDRVLAAYCSYGRLYVDRGDARRIFRTRR